MGDACVAPTEQYKRNKRAIGFEPTDVSLEG